MAVKFHEKALALFVLPQLTEGNSASKRTFTLTGTATITTGSPTITGVSSKYLTELKAGDIITNVAGTVVGTVFSVTSDLLATLTANGAVAVTAAAIINSKTAGTITTGLASTAVTGVGTTFLTDLVPGGYIKDLTGAIVGQVNSVTTDTAAVLVSNALIALSAAKYATGLGPLNAVAVVNFNYSKEIDSEAFQYLGDELNRDEETSIKDTYCKTDFEVFVPSLGTIAGTDPVASEVPLAPLFTSSGMALVLSTGSQGFAKFTNSLASNSFLTIEVRRSSPDLVVAGTQKVYTLTDARGTIDLDGVIGTRGKLKFNYQGNLLEIAQQLKITENFGDQKAEHAPSMSSKTITTSELQLYVGATEPTITNVKNFCFDKLTAPNFAGFDYQRFLTSCEDGWSKGATPTDVTLAILEDSADAIYNPDNNLEANHALSIKFGNFVGKKTEFTFHKLQLTKITSSKIGTYVAQELGFRNVGSTDLILR